MRSTGYTREELLEIILDAQAEEAAKLLAPIFHTQHWTWRGNTEPPNQAEIKVALINLAQGVNEDSYSVQSGRLMAFDSNVENSGIGFALVL